MAAATTRQASLFPNTALNVDARLGEVDDLIVLARVDDQAARKHTLVRRAGRLICTAIVTIIIISGVYRFAY